VWQGLYEELGPSGFVPIAVALDTRGAEDAREWIEAAKPTYPCLIDAHHVVADLYGMVNVPNAVWIDERGRIVRPAEAAGSSDAFRATDRTTFRMPEEATQQTRAARRAYLDALRDWVRNGERSAYALSAEEARQRSPALTDDDALAAVHFRLGVHLWERGRAEEAQQHFAAAKRLSPDDWRYKRQAWHLEQKGKAGGPEFWAAVDALGDRTYYPPARL
jgi:tetratricopeptide (TPR) repeat protein